MVDFLVCLCLLFGFVCLLVVLLCLVNSIEFTFAFSLVLGLLVGDVVF